MHRKHSTTGKNWEEGSALAHVKTGYTVPRVGGYPRPPISLTNSFWLSGPGRAREGAKGIPPYSNKQMQSHDPPQRDADLELHAEKVRAPIGWGQQEVMMERAGPGRVKVSVFHLENVVSVF